MAELIHWNCSTISMELVNEINGIGQRNQWNWFLKAAVLADEDAKMARRNRQNTCGRVASCLWISAFLMLELGRHGAEES